MQSTSRGTTRWACKKHKDFVLAAAVHKGHMEPRIARPECSPEEIATSIAKRPKAKVLHVAPKTMHYHWSGFLANEVEVLQFRSGKIDAMADSTSNDGAASVKPPDEMRPIEREDRDATSAELSDMPPIGKKPKRLPFRQ